MHLFPGQERVLRLLKGRPDQVEALGHAPGLCQLLRCPLAGPPCMGNPQYCSAELTDSVFAISGLKYCIAYVSMQEYESSRVAATQMHERRVSP